MNLIIKGVIQREKKMTVMMALIFKYNQLLEKLPPSTTVVTFT